MYIGVKTLNKTVIFAAEELKKYLKMMFPDYNSELVFSEKVDFSLGLFSDMGIDYPHDDDNDCIYIKTDGKGGIISGNNPRSVLLAVYEYLRRQGCRWLFPGIDGESIALLSELKNVNIQKEASQKIRGQCIEGAVSYENVLSAIDYAPKVGLNSFMLECYNPKGYFERYYNHSGTVGKTAEHITAKNTLQWKRSLEAEISKRGLLYNDMGHGFTTGAFGMYDNDDLGDFKDYQYLAEIDGKRGIFWNDPIYTNFCMSNTGARSKFVNYIVDYAKKHDNVDMLHIWLADAIGNQCECEGCSKYSPSEWYVIALNEVDSHLTKLGISTKLVFVVYCDLLWAPEKVSFNNPDRFMLLFAPISRKYTLNYGIDSDKNEIMPYVRNKSQMPKTMQGNLAYLDKWQEIFKGTAFSYEYHFYFLSYFDLSSLSMAKCVYDDAFGINKNGITGMIEDQSQRCSFPNNFPTYIWARTMWDKDVNFEDVLIDYFSSAYGSDWQKAYDYLKSFSELIPFSYMIDCFKDRGNLKNDTLLENLDKLSLLSDNIKPVCMEHLTGDRCYTTSWKLLLYLADMCRYYIPFLKRVASFDIDGALKELDTLIEFLSKHENEFQPYFDVFLFNIRMKSALENREQEIDIT